MITSQDSPGFLENLKQMDLQNVSKVKRGLIMGILKELKICLAGKIGRNIKLPKKEKRRDNLKSTREPVLKRENIERRKDVIKQSSNL